MRMEQLADSDAKPTLASHLNAGPNAVAFVTVSANSNQYWVLDWVSWSYSAAPTGGNLKVFLGGVVVWEIDVTAAGPQHFEFNKPLYTGVKNQSLSVQLGLAGATVTGKVNIRYR